MKFKMAVIAIPFIRGVFGFRCNAQEEYYWVPFDTDECYTIRSNLCTLMPYYVPPAPCDFQDCEPFEGGWACGGQEFRLTPVTFYEFLDEREPFEEGSTEFEMHISDFTYCQQVRSCHPECGENLKCKVDPDANWGSDLSNFVFPKIRYRGDPTCVPIITQFWRVLSNHVALCGRYLNFQPVG